MTKRRKKLLTLSVLGGLATMSLAFPVQAAELNVEGGKTVGTSPAPIEYYGVDKDGNIASDNAVVNVGKGEPTEITDKIVGGTRSDTGTLKNNLVTITSGILPGNVYGAYAGISQVSAEITASGNEVNMLGGTGKKVVGARVFATKASLTDNKAVVKKAKATDDVLAANGETSGTLIVNKNAVEIDTATVARAGELHIGTRAESDHGTISATGNSVDINNADIEGAPVRIAGVHAHEVEGLATDEKPLVTANDNSVKIKDSRITITTNPTANKDNVIYGAFVDAEEAVYHQDTTSPYAWHRDRYGTRGNLEATGNSVTLENVTITNDHTALDPSTIFIEGAHVEHKGYGKYQAAGDHDAYGNATATDSTALVMDSIIPSSLSHAYGAYVSAQRGTASADLSTAIVVNSTVAEVKGAEVSSARGAASANKSYVIIENSTVDEVTGADVKGLTNVSANDSTVVLDGATVEGDVFGSKINTVNAQAQTVFSSENNVIAFRGKESNIGGIVGASNVDSTGNMLIVENKGNVIGQLKNDFETIEYTLPKDTKNNETIIKVTTKDETDITDVQKLKNVTTRSDLKPGEKVYLIEKVSTADLNTPDLSKETVDIINGPFNAWQAVYGLDAKTGADYNDLALNVTDKRIYEEQTEANRKSVVETRAASAALLAQGNDFLLGTALSEAKIAAAEGEEEEETKNTFLPFVAIQGSSMKYKSGSHIDAKGTLGTIGFAKNIKDWTVGFAVEHGKSSYDSYVGNVHGKGNNKYTGGAIFGEMKKASGGHFDVALRAGRVKNDYNGVLTVGPLAMNTDYNEKSNYIGFSLGGGKETRMGKGLLDLYARYAYNRVAGTDATVRYDNTSEQLRLDSINSNRIRLGARYSQDVDKKNTLFAGLAWLYEINGKARGSVGGYSTPEPSLKGHSGLLELGWKAAAAKNLSLDVNLNFWAGKQRGITGGIGLKWLF